MTAKKLIPIAFIVAFVMIFYSLWKVGIIDSLKMRQDKDVSEITANIDFELKSPNQNDHTLGNPNAPIKIIEYIDTDCGHCEDMQRNLNTLLSEKILAGEVSWTIRHFITENENYTESKSLECVGQLSGSQKFWDMIDFLFQKEKTPEPEILSWVTENGIERSSFVNCLNDKRTEQTVNEDLDSGISAGVIGTPYVFVLSESGEINQIVGLHPIVVIESVINQTIGVK